MICANAAGRKFASNSRTIDAIFWDHIAPELMSGHDQLIVAMAQGLRLLKIEGISNEDIVKVKFQMQNQLFIL